MNVKIESFSFEGEKDGPTLVVLGAVHGNEKCGTVAINRVKAELEAGKVILAAGRLIVVPVSNPGAYAENKRFLERNLNRNLYPKPPGERKFYEDHLDEQICALLAQGDWLLDIHSYTAGGPPFIFISGKDAVEKEFAEKLGVTHNFLWGWQDAFKDANAPEKESQGTTEYARTQDCRGVTLECGQHLDPLSPNVAYTAILNAMTYLGLVNKAETEALPLPPLGPRQFARMRTIVYSKPSAMARPFRHFEAVKKGEILATHTSGEQVFAEIDGYIIMPKPNGEIGEALLYVAVDDEPFRKP